MAKLQYLPNLKASGLRIPSYGIFWWTLVRIKREFLRQLLSEWLKILGLKDQVLVVDGKCLRGTQESATFNPTLHFVSLFVAEKGIILAQQPVENKSNEITAIPSRSNQYSRLLFQQMPWDVKKILQEKFVIMAQTMY